MEILYYPRSSVHERNWPYPRRGIWAVKVQLRHFLMKSLYQSIKLSGHVNVSEGIDFTSFRNISIGI